MIKRISIQNFQSLKAIELHLGAVTVITGQTDSGKSALIRAVQAACYNAGYPDYLTVEGGKQAERMQVAIEVPDVTVFWERTKTAVRYRVERATGGQIYEKLGRANVPDEVKHALGIWDVQIDASQQSLQRLQFVEQFDPPFLLADRGGVASSRVVGRLTGIHIFSDAAKRAAAEYSNKDTRLVQLRDREAVLQTELCQYQGVEERLVQLRSLESQLAKLKQRQNCLERLRQIRLLATNIQVDLSRDATTDQQLMGWNNQVPAFQALWTRLGVLERVRKLAGELRLATHSLSSPVKELPVEMDLKPRITLWETKKVLQASLKKYAGVLDTSTKVLVDLQQKSDTSSADLTAFAKTFPLCPFQEQFTTQNGIYRCAELMRVLEEREAH